jgi:hypothetical protein
MYRNWVAVALLLGAGATLSAQAPPPQIPGSVNNPFQMPGTPVGKPIVSPVGSQINKAAQQVGTAVGTGPGGVPAPLDPRAPKPAGQEVDLKNVIAPYPGMPKPEMNFWQKLEDRWFKLFESDQPAVRPPQWTPGIARRNREREKERMARRD